MKKVLLAICAFVVAVCSCSKINEIDAKVGELDSRVTSLEKLCDNINTNIAAMQSLINALNQKKQIDKVEETAGGVKITFSDGQVVAVRDGQPGGKGDKGDTPVISAALDNGVYYWTVNGEWMIVDGQKVSAVGVTPQLKIENKKWYVSYDKGQSWTEVAPAYDPDKYLTVTQDDDNVYFTLPDQTVITIPKVPGFKFRVLDVDDIALKPGEVAQIPYTIAKGDETVRFVVTGDNYGAKVIPADVNGGVIEVTAPDPIVEGYLLVTAVQNSTGESKAQYMSFTLGKTVIVTPAKEAPTVGGEFSIDMRVNCDFTVNIPAEDQNWISVVQPTKAMMDTTVTFLIQPNFTQLPRQSTVTITTATGAPVDYTISQKGEKVDPVFNVDTTPINLSYNETTATVRVEGTVLWTVTLSDPAMSANKLSGAGPADITITLPENKKTTVANYSVTVSSPEETLPVKEFVVPISQTAAPDPNDYYAQYQAGEDIVIGGFVVNKEKYPVSSLVKAYEFTNANYLTYEKYGVVFLDYDAADGKEDTYQIGSNLKPENMIIIGRYRNHQPRFTFAGSATIGPVKTMIALKNVRFETTNYSVTTGNETCPLNLYIEDCTMITTSDFAFCQANKTVENNYESINVVNSIISCVRSVVAQNSQVPAGSTYTSLKKLYFKNTVFTAPATTAGYGAFQLRTNSAGGYLSPNVDIEIDHCTFHNFNSTGLGILPVVSAKSIVFDYNVIGVALGKGCAFVQVGNAPLDPKISGSVSGNNAYSSTANTWAVEFSSSKLLTNSGLTVAGNTCKTNDDPFADDMDAANLYIPINTSKVTNGAGASYETKLWNTWTK